MTTPISRQAATSSGDSPTPGVVAKRDGGRAERIQARRDGVECVARHRSERAVAVERRAGAARKRARSPVSHVFGQIRQAVDLSDHHHDGIEMVETSARRVGDANARFAGGLAPRRRRAALRPILVGQVGAHRSTSSFGRAALRPRRPSGAHGNHDTPIKLGDMRRFTDDFFSFWRWTARSSCADDGRACGLEARMCGRFAITLPPEAVRALLRLCRTAQFSPALQHRADAADSDRRSARAHRRARAAFSARALGLPARLRQGPQDVSAPHQRARGNAGGRSRAFAPR